MTSGRARAGLLTAILVLGIVGCSGAARPEPRGSVLTPPAPRAPVTTSVAGPEAMTVMARSIPVRLRIPSIGVDSGLISLGLAKDGTMQVPPSGSPAGWYTGAPTPGELGPAIIAGHVDWAGRPGVFYRLRELRPDQTITVFRADGTVAVFRVTAVKQFAKDEFPTHQIYGNIDRAGLRLITCGGSFDRRAHSYRDNIVAFAQLSSKRVDQTSSASSAKTPRSAG